jgi:predicted metal-dependent hydrolase
MKLLRALVPRIRSPLPPTVRESFDLGDVTVTITFKRHAAARRFTLRLSRDGSGFVMTLPRRARLDDARAFAVKSANWMRKTIARQPPAISVAHGATVSLRGTEYCILSTGKIRGQVALDATARQLHLPGAPQHLRRRLMDWLKAEAAHDLDVASRKYAQLMGVRIRKITIRDQKSRWGSCSSDGSLSYSWRLVMAPAMVLDYVAAHEVAHLREMNHSPRFWRLVLQHCPNAKPAKTWLKLYGSRLHGLA